MKKNSVLALVLNLALATSTSVVRADVSLPKIIGDNMVLQRDQPVPVWGWAAAGEKVTVEFAGQRKSTVTQADGRWQVKLHALKTATQPLDLVITGANKITLTNILVGEVWFCSGQSNMEKPLGTQPGQKPTRNYQQELAQADLPQIRLFKIDRLMSPTPLRDLASNSWWRACSSNALEQTRFSAAAYFFGREIQKNLGVPVGLVMSSWGGTYIEPWTPPEGFKMVSKLKDIPASPLPAGRLPNATPSVLFNGMVAPAIPFAIRGAIWYQGENNCIGDTTNESIYTDKMEAMIGGWRKLWSLGNFPFYYVQIAPFNYFHATKPRVPGPESLPEFWEAQTRALRIPNTGMAVITDLVEDLNDIHPTQKKEVGQRLANLALAKTYGRKDIVSEGPMFKSTKFSQGKATLTFAHTDGGLASKDGRPLTWFTIAGDDGKFVEAKAEISGNKIIVSADSVKEPKAVRFGWDEQAQPNLFNQAGLPAAPFRTDAPAGR